jgi:hypothetical protein
MTESTTGVQTMIEITETKNARAVCPHCEQQLGRIEAIKTKSTFGVRFIYVCNQCRKVLGVSHRKGFFMG